MLSGAETKEPTQQLRLIWIFITWSFLLNFQTLKWGISVGQARNRVLNCPGPCAALGRLEIALDLQGSWRCQYWQAPSSMCRSAIPELVRLDSVTRVYSLTRIMNDGAPRPCHIWTEESFYISRAVFFHLCSSPTKKNILKGKHEAPPGPDTPALVQASSCAWPWPWARLNHTKLAHLQGEAEPLCWQAE